MRLFLSVWAASWFLLAGCAAPRDGGVKPSVPTIEEKLAQEGLRMEEEVLSIFPFHIYGWRYVDDSHLVLDAGVGREYLVTLAFPCMELGRAWRLGYTTTTGSLSVMDKVLVLDMGRPVRCPIRTIHRLMPLE